MKSIKEKLKRIVRWLNKNYNQNSKNYSIFDGARPVINYDEHTAISFWACGAIVCIESLLYFISEDDGYWFMQEDENGCYAFQEMFSIGWAISLADALRRLVEYTEKNGKPVYYTGIEPKMICHYEL